jgi:HK97 family phage major capsid protein
MMPMPDDDRVLSLPLTLDRAAADAEKLEIPVSFASDAIIDDPWNGPTKLSMDPSAIDLSVAADRGLPVHRMHMRDLPVGRVTGIEIDGTRLRGTMRFSASDQGRALYRDCVDGIITDTSVGAAIYAIREEDDYIVAIRWRPREVSLVDEGADQSVGINRSTQIPTPAAQAAIQPKETVMPAESIEQTAEGTRSADTGVNRDAINIHELSVYAHKRAPELGIDRMGADYVAFGKPFEEFRTKVWEMLSERQAKTPPVAAPPAELGLSRNEVQEFSILRASIAALTGNWKHAGFELECSRAVAERLGREARGFFVPLEVQRTMSTGDAAKGGTLVGTDHRADLFIESLRATAAAFRAGARMLPGLMGNVSIPKMTNNAAFYWLVEGQDAIETEPATGAVTMRPRTIAGAVPMTRRLLMQSSPAVEQLVREDLVRGAALALDDAIFEGDGTTAPLGIVNTSGVNTQAVSTDGSPTWAEMVGFESEVATDNALMGSLAYVTTPAVVGKLKTTSKDAGSGLMLMDGNTCNGYPVYSTTQIATHRIVFGNFSDVLVGMWGVLEIKPDEAALAASGGLVLRVFQDADVAVRHGESFCYAT